MEPEKDNQIVNIDDDGTGPIVPGNLNFEAEEDDELMDIDRAIDDGDDVHVGDDADSSEDEENVSDLDDDRFFVVDESA